jgi:HAMP domain-containing protein
MAEPEINPRKRFIINPRYQWQHATFTILCLLPLSALYPVVILNIFDYFIMRTSQGSPVDAAVLAFRSGVIARLVLLQVSFVILVALVSLYLSHRTAGPVYKLMQAMRELREGRFRAPLTFRKRDFFSELAGEFNQAFEGFSKAQQALTDIEGRIKNIDPKLRAELDAIIQNAKAPQQIRSLEHAVDS